MRAAADPRNRRRLKKRSRPASSRAGTNPRSHRAQSPANQWVLLAAGGDYALVPGPMSIAAGADAGVAWRNTRHAADAGEAQSWGAYPMLAPTLTLRQHLGERAALALTGQLMVLDVFSSAQLSPALTLGLSIR
jgi:hypothetical protein